MVRAPRREALLARQPLPLPSLPSRQRKRTARHRTALCWDRAGAVHMRPSTTVLRFGAAEWMELQGEAMWHEGEQHVIAAVTASVQAIARSRATLARCVIWSPMGLGSRRTGGPADQV
jgi:hypothetical protein